MDGDGVLRVLLVEDDVPTAEMYRRRLEAEEYQVTVVGDGETALAIAGESPPDLLFLDLRLPGLDGLQTLERLRAEPATRDLPVVILSNASEPELVARGFALGARDFLVKSRTTPAEIAARVADLAGGGSDEARLLYGEDPSARDAEDVDHWIAVYEEMRDSTRDFGYSQSARFEDRLKFWRGRRAELEGDSREADEAGEPTEAAD